MGSIREMIGVPCQGTPRNPEQHAGFQLLRRRIFWHCEKKPNVSFTIVLAGPKTFDAELSESMALYRCLVAVEMPKNIANIRCEEHTRNVREHIELFADISGGLHTTVICEAVAERQVQFHLERNTFPGGVTLDPVPFNPHARSWLNLHVKQPLREWLDQREVDTPLLFARVKAWSQRANIAHARRTER